MIENLAQLVNRDPAIVRWARDTEAAVARIPGAKFTVMKGLGHFPMSENPEAFLGYLRPVLDEIRQRERS